MCLGSPRALKDGEGKSEMSKCRKRTKVENRNRKPMSKDMERSGERCKDKKAKAVLKGAVMRLLL
jgi:hypothetical protein